MSERKRTKVSVDSIDGNIAVLVGKNHSINIPVSWLPDGVSEGTALKLITRLDAQEGDAQADRVAALQDRLKRR